MLTHNTDPMVRIRLPKEQYEKLQRLAQYNARSIKDEIIARLAAVMHHRADDAGCGHYIKEMDKLSKR